MSRRVKVPNSFGIELLTISKVDGVFEREWAPLQGNLLCDLFSVINRRTLEEALRGHLNPLRCALGLQPKGVLRKLQARPCAQKSVCSMYDPHRCWIKKSVIPSCFHLDTYDLKTDQEIYLAHYAIINWLDGVYVVVVDESNGQGVKSNNYE